MKELRPILVCKISTYNNSSRVAKERFSNIAGLLKEKLEPEYHLLVFSEPNIKETKIQIFNSDFTEKEFEILRNEIAGNLKPIRSKDSKNMGFHIKLNDKQQDKFDKWLVELELVHGESENIEWIISYNSGIGPSIKVRSKVDYSILDLTDVETW